MLCQCKSLLPHHSQNHLSRAANLLFGLPGWISSVVEVLCGGRPALVPISVIKKSRIGLALHHEPHQPFSESRLKAGSRQVVTRSLLRLTHPENAGIQQQ